MKNRKGIIRISKDSYDNCWGLIHMLFKEFKPYHIEFSVYENDMYRFYGYSENFDPLEEGGVIPFYDVIFTLIEEGSYSFRFEKK